MATVNVARVLVLALAGTWACRGERYGGASGPVTYAEDIVPILRDQCAGCHRPEGVGPFPLLTYADAVEHAEAIVAATTARRMPPWPADPSYSRFTGERTLSDGEVERLRRWLAAGTPPGDTGGPIALPSHIDSSSLGTPDLVVAMAEPFPLPGDGRDHFVMIKVPFTLPQDTFARAIEFVPGRSGAVHHMNGHLIAYAEGAKATVFGGRTYVEDPAMHNDALPELDLLNDDGSYPPIEFSVVNYLPGAYPTAYPPGIGGFRLPRQGAFLINEMHYGPSAERGADRSYFNIFLDSVPPERPVFDIILGTAGVSPVVPPLIIPPDSILHVTTRFRVPKDIAVVTVNPHMHLLGRSFTAYAVTAAGDTIPLIRIPRWDFRWQYFYTFRRPVRIPAGAAIVAEGVYDNTAANPHNPFDPPREVRDRNGSMRTTDEMFQLILTYLPYRPGDEAISLERGNLGGWPRE